LVQTLAALVFVCLVGMLDTSTTGYLPSWGDVLVSGGIVADGLLALAVMNEMLPISQHKELSLES